MAACDVVAAAVTSRRRRERLPQKKSSSPRIRYILEGEEVPHTTQPCSRRRELSLFLERGAKGGDQQVGGGGQILHLIFPGCLYIFHPRSFLNCKMSSATFPPDPGDSDSGPSSSSSSSTSSGVPPTPADAADAEARQNATWYIVGMGVVSRKATTSGLRVTSWCSFFIQVPSVLFLCCVAVILIRRRRRGQQQQQKEEQGHQLEGGGGGGGDAAGEEEKTKLRSSGKRESDREGGTS